MKNDRGNIILSKSDIQQLRANIMKYENLSKEKAINKILRLLND